MQVLLYGLGMKRPGLNLEPCWLELQSYGTLVHVSRCFAKPHFRMAYHSMNWIRSGFVLKI